MYLIPNGVTVKKIGILTAYILFLTITSQYYVNHVTWNQGSHDYEYIENKYMYELEETDRLWFIYVGYNSLRSEVSHKLIVSNTTDLGNIIYTEWQNYTLKSEYHKNVEFNIPSTVIQPNSTIYYKTQVLDRKQKILAESAIQQSTNVIDDNSTTYSQMVKSGEERGYDYPWNWCYEILWDETTQQFWFLSSGEKEFTKKA